MHTRKSHANINANAETKGIDTKNDVFLSL